MCIDRFVPDDRAAAAEAAALRERPDNRLIVPLGGPMGVPRDLGRPRMAIVTEAMWEAGSELAVRFVDGDADVQRRVEEVAHAWEEHANIRFAFGDAPDATIRISFAQEGSWSYLGTVAREIPRNEPTMNYGWLTADSDDQEVRRVVLHEFGHALGCIHEHQSPDVSIPWDREAVYAYYARQGWSRSQVDSNLFAAYSPQGIQFSRFDRESIMLYAVDDALTEGEWSVGWNTELSDADKAFIRERYPSEKAPEPELSVGGAPMDGEIGADGEADLFRFRIDADGRYSIQTLGPTDVVLSLHGPDDDTALLAADDDSGWALNARIERELRPGRYLAIVRHWHPRGSGGYQVALDRVA
jgi:hypothetical protein